MNKEIEALPKEEALEGDKEMTYAEALLILEKEGELSLELPFSDLDKVKTGIKNLRAKMNVSLKEMNLPVPEETLSFVSFPAEEKKRITLVISYKRRGTFTARILPAITDEDL